ncbi:hypothetical protein O9992_09105 [Vibrio lentus]|nr:hypothetical protein [Vibrio lentus]
MRIEPVVLDQVSMFADGVAVKRIGGKPSVFANSTLMVILPSPAMKSALR